MAPTLTVLYALSLFLHCSGIFSILATTAGEARWRARFIKVTNFFSTLLYCGIILVILYNLCPTKPHSEGSATPKLGNIGLSLFTYLYCGIVPYAMVSWNVGLLKRLENKIREKQESNENMKVNSTQELLKVKFEDNRVAK